MSSLRSDFLDDVVLENKAVDRNRQPSRYVKQDHVREEIVTGSVNVRMSSSSPSETWKI